MTLIILVTSISLIFSQSNDLNKLRHLSGGIVSGETKDENGNLLIGANIFIKGTKFGGASNQKGKFRISNISTFVFCCQVAEDTSPNVPEVEHAT